MIGLQMLPDLAPSVVFGWVGRLFLLVLLAGVPALALVRPDRESLELPPRPGLYASAATVLWILAGLTGLVLLIEDVSLAEVGLEMPGARRLAFWSLAATLLALGGSFLITRVGGWLGARESWIVFYLIPRTRSERHAFLGLSATAGFCEELTYHGYVVAGLASWLGSGWLAALVANLAFGVLHGYQNAIGMIRAFLMGFALTIPVVVGAGLWPGILAHFLVNTALGLGLWRWVLPRDHLPPDLA